MKLATQNLGDLFDLENDADRVLLIDCRDPAAPREWTGAELDAQANAVARGLLKRGYEPGERIAILSANRAEFLTAYFGIMRATRV